MLHRVRKIKAFVCHKISRYVSISRIYAVFLPPEGRKKMKPNNTLLTKQVKKQYYIHNNVEGSIPNSFLLSNIKPCGLFEGERRQSDKSLLQLLPGVLVEIQPLSLHSLQNQWNRYCILALPLVLPAYTCNKASETQKKDNC